MKLTFPLLAAVAALSALALPQRADACGGCFTPPSQSTQVSGHRMILSVSPQMTTLWDQIQYAGNPTDFASILPVHRTVTIGLSSDALFDVLDELTDARVIIPPYPQCGASYCDATATTGAFMSGATGSSSAS